MLNVRTRGTQVTGALTRGMGQVRGGLGAIPPTLHIFLAIVSIQVGAGVAKHLFERVGPVGTVSVRVGFAALALLVWWRPRIRGYRRAELGAIAGFGLVLGAMNFAFYSALARLPLGIAVTLEFLGPLGVALSLSRRVRDALWALLAGAGILLLSPVGQDVAARLDPIGVAFALMSAVCWAAYIFLSRQVGRIAPGGAGLALAMGVAAVIFVPIGVVMNGAALLDPGLLVAGCAVALLSTALPYTLEMEALRRLPTRVFGVLMSVEPVIAALIGFVVLREAIAPRALAAICLITVAAIGAAQTGTATTEP